LLGLLTVLVVVFAGSTTVPRTADAVVPGAVGRIVFVSDRDDIYGEVYTRAFGGGAWTRLTSNTASDADPVWSPDGSQIAYTSESSGDRNVWVMDADGSSKQNLTNSAVREEEPDWSPDGSRIVFMSYGVSGMSDVWVMNADGSGRVNLTPSTAGSSELEPVWSPDGSKIAFTWAPSGSLDVYVMNTNGGEVTNLSKTLASYESGPAWSPDGSQIAFVSDRASGVPQLFVMDADGSDVQRLTTVAKALDKPAWSPDGRHILFTSLEDGDADLWSVDPDGSNLGHLTDHPGNEWSGGWESVNRLPSAIDDGPYFVRPGGTLNGSSVLGNDSDPDGEALSALLKVGPVHAASFTLYPDGLFTYVHDGGVAVTDSFRYAAVDTRSGVSNVVTVSIKVGVPHTVGLVDPGSGVWRLRDSGGVVTSFYYGDPGDVPFMGDWDCDTVATPGLFRTSDAFAYLRNSNSQGIADIRFFFGNPSDIPLAGDFNGDGCDTLSIYRPSEARFYIINKLGENEGGLGAAEYSFLFGNPGDKPVVGDWDGDGIDEIGLHRESSGFFYYRNTLTTGVADGQFYFGDPGDRFVAGDWGIVDGADTPGLFRPSNLVFYFRHDLTQGNADSQFTWTGAGTGWLPVAGDFKLN
jgi:Tol biopolymer transport system component